METWFNEPLYNEVLDKTNDFPGPSKSKIYGKEPQYNESRYSEHIFQFLGPSLYQEVPLYLVILKRVQLVLIMATNIYGAPMSKNFHKI